MGKLMVKSKGWVREDILYLAAAYFFCGAFGLSFASINKSATPIWPPAGLALAILILKGRELWPGVFLGAFLINISTQGTVWTSLGIALGNTLEAYSGAWLVSHYAGGERAFDRIPNIFGLAFLAGIMSTAVSATFGVTTLCLGGLAPWGQYSVLWITWWLGDMVSVLSVAPLLMLWLRRPVERPKLSQ